MYNVNTLNNFFREKEIERLKRQKDRQDKINENKKKENDRKSRKDFENTVSISIYIFNSIRTETH